ncbi:MAG: type II toxin-antitoxin system VapC family toxin [Methanobacteriota archaeon]
MRNSLDTLLLDSKIFVDANIFLYAILGHPALKPRCQKFLMNIENGQYRAMTSSLVLNEVLHKLMLTEAVRTYGLSSERDALKLIKEKPELISNMSMVWMNYSELKKYPITIFSIDEEALNMAVLLSRKYGLLISDAVHAAIMKINSIDNIATNDGDFERIEGITVWKP